MKCVMCNITIKTVPLVNSNSSSSYSSCRVCSSSSDCCSSITSSSRCSISNNSSCNNINNSRCSFYRGSSRRHINKISSSYSSSSSTSCNFLRIRLDLVIIRAFIKMLTMICKHSKIFLISSRLHNSKIRFLIGHVKARITKTFKLSTNSNTAANQCKVDVSKQIQCKQVTNKVSNKSTYKVRMFCLAEVVQLTHKILFNKLGQIMQAHVGKITTKCSTKKHEGSLPKPRRK